MLSSGMEFWWEFDSFTLLKWNYFLVKGFGFFKFFFAYLQREESKNSNDEEINSVDVVSLFLIIRLSPRSFCKSRKLILKNFASLSVGHVDYKTLFQACKALK